MFEEILSDQRSLYKFQEMSRMKAQSMTWQIATRRVAAGSTKTPTWKAHAGNSCAKRIERLVVVPTRTDGLDSCPFDFE